MSDWIKIEAVLKYEVVDLWASEQPGGGCRRWPDCWWGPSFPQPKCTTEDWYCRLGSEVFRVYPTHFMFPPPPPVEP
jgi:hypothetical protein